ncbi:hypothetical protein HDU85_001579 [Gaertneriomyces sp. JEL0708]|nr:hypothetical protein HDU85_001579 [Gaertneriomyces sp. JEL0708]
MLSDHPITDLNVLVILMICEALMATSVRAEGNHCGVGEGVLLDVKESIAGAISERRRQQVIATNDVAGRGRTGTIGKAQWKKHDDYHMRRQATRARREYSVFERKRRAEVARQYMAVHEQAAGEPGTDERCVQINKLSKAHDDATIFEGRPLVPKGLSTKEVDAL